MGLKNWKTRAINIYDRHLNHTLRYGKGLARCQKKHLTFDFITKWQSARNNKKRFGERQELKAAPNNWKSKTDFNAKIAESILISLICKLFALANVNKNWKFFFFLTPGKFANH